MKTNSCVTGIVLAVALPAALLAQGPALSLSASPVTGASTALTMNVSDPNGYDANSTAQILVSWDGGGVDACYLIYNIQANALYLVDDTGSTMLGPVAPGTTPQQPLQNSQCAINTAQTTANVSGNNVSLNVAVTFDPSFVGLLAISPGVTDTTGTLTQNLNELSYTAFAANASPPAIVSLPIPDPGFGTSISGLTMQVTDPNGAKYVRFAGITLCCDSQGGTSYMLYYTPAAGAFSADSVAGVMSGGPASFTVSRSGNTLTVGANSIQFYGFADSLGGQVSLPSGRGGPTPIQGQASDAVNNFVSGGGGTWWLGNVKITSPPSLQQYAMSQAGSGTIVVDVSAETQWTATSQVPWMQVTGGGGPGPVSYSYQANQTGSYRSGCILLDDTTDVSAHGGIFASCLQISQDTVSFSPTTFSFEAAGGSGTVNVTSAGAWNGPLDSDSWVHLGSSPGTGNSSFSFTVDANSSGVARSSSIAIGAAGRITVNQGATSLTISAPSPMPGGTAGIPYAVALTGAGGVVPYSWSLNSGSLPAGLSLSATTGLISGTPGAGGTSNFSVQLSDGSGLTAISSSLSISVQAANITSASPMSGVAGTPVTITGSGFGSAPGTVWLGSTPGVVTSWSNTQITASVASSALSGIAEVQQGAFASNTIPFTVATATISSVTPNSNVLPGAQVTVMGSGFGASQANGQVRLGTAYGAVQSWSDTQVVATVAANAMSGNAQVLQGGVWSNAVPVTVDALRIAGISPNSGVPGTQVTFTGTGFGSTQGSGVVWLGSAAASVVTWSDTQVVANVAAGALTGIARVQQNGAWSNALGFTVPATNGNSVMPARLNMVVGDAHAIQALNSTGQSVAGLTWTSSNTAIVSLSTDDPPVLTAVAAGHVTISAGAGSADVTVYAPDPVTGALPMGTLVWSNPGDGSGVFKIVPAVPSASGVADVFALQNDGTVQAITSDGLTAWTADASGALNGYGEVIPDFQGGAVLVNMQGGAGYSIVKLDGLTGQPLSTYSSGQFLNECCLHQYAVVHPNGTLFTVQAGASGPFFSQANGPSISGINLSTGSAIFTVPIPLSPTVQLVSINSLIIAGDGSAYVAYRYTDNSGKASHLRLIRVDSTGTASTVAIADQQTINSPSADFALGSMITNADQGVLLTWTVTAPTSGTPISFGMATSDGSSVSLLNSPSVPGQFGIAPVLQAQDGSFVGTETDSNGQTNMVAFDLSGNVRWTAPNDTPAIATADGGVVGQSGITYDQSGNATGLTVVPIQSWQGNQYQIGSIDQINSPAILVAQSLWAQINGSPSKNSTAGRQWQFALSFANDFTFTPGNPNLLPGLTTNINNWATTIKAAAVTQLKAAFKGLPVWAYEGQKGDVLVTVLNHQTLGNVPDCGASEPDPTKFPPVNIHQVDYALNMVGAQDALNIIINNATGENAVLQPGSQIGLNLFQGLGRGIGVSAAHEIAHEYVEVPPMDDNPANVPAARGTYNATGCNGHDDPSPWTGSWPSPIIALHWEPSALSQLRSSLGSAWHKR